jgi:hypothetical protein
VSGQAQIPHPLFMTELHLGRNRAGKEEDERALGRAERRHASIRPLELKSEMSTITKFLKSVLVHLT